MLNIGTHHLSAAKLVWPVLTPCINVRSHYPDTLPRYWDCVCVCVWMLARCKFNANSCAQSWHKFIRMGVKIFHKWVPKILLVTAHAKTLVNIATEEVFTSVCACVYVSKIPQKVTDKFLWRAGSWAKEQYNRLWGGSAWHFLNIIFRPYTAIQTACPVL